MFYLRRKDGKDITPVEMLVLYRYLNEYRGPLKIAEWDNIEIPDVREVLGKVLVTPYNGSTIGIPDNGVPDGMGPYRRNKVISTLLMDVDYEATGLPNESWSRKEIVEFMGLPEEELSERCIYLPPIEGNPIDPNEIGKKKSWEPRP